MTYLPSTIPTTTEPVGPAHGISEILSATDEPNIASGSGAISGSTDNAVATTVTSLKSPLGNKGLIGLSISLDTRIALSLALPSLFLKPPGILPTEYIFSSVTFTITTVSPHLTMQDPFACWAYLPTSTETSLPPIVVVNTL